MRRHVIEVVMGILAVIFVASAGIVFAQGGKSGQKSAQGEPFTVYSIPRGGNVNAFMVEKIIGSKVRNLKGEDLGTIKDIVVDIDSGKVLYAVMDFGSILGIGGKLFPVPWDILLPLPSEGIFFLNVSKDKLKDAPGYNKNDLPDMGDVHWGTKVADFYDLYGGRRHNVYDYGYGPIMYPNIAQEDPLAKTFDPKSMKTITGEVIKVDSVIPDKGTMSQMQLELIVLVNNKEAVPVYVGPIWYILRPDRSIPFKSGDSISITGSWITSRTEPFMIATTVTKGTETLKLREKNGRPVWNAWEKMGDITPP